MLIVRFLKNLGLWDPGDLPNACAWLLKYSQARSFMLCITGASRYHGTVNNGHRGSDDCGEESGDLLAVSNPGEMSTPLIVYDRYEPYFRWVFALLLTMRAAKYLSIEHRGAAELVNVFANPPMVLKDPVAQAALLNFKDWGEKSANCHAKSKLLAAFGQLTDRDFEEGFKGTKVKDGRWTKMQQVPMMGAVLKVAALKDCFEECSCATRRRC